MPLTNIRYDHILVFQGFFNPSQKAGVSPDLDSLKAILTKSRMITLEKFFGRKNAKETAGVDNGEVLDNSVRVGAALHCIQIVLQC